MLRGSVAGVVPVLYRKFVLINLIYISGTIVGFNEKQSAGSEFKSPSRPNF